MRARRILLVCSGNTCRSPIAAALLAAQTAGIDRPIEVRSAGTTACAAAPASEMARAVMAERALDIDHHRAARLDAAHLAWATDVWVMSRQHRAHILRSWPEATGARVRLLSEVAGEAGDVPDPHGGRMTDYRRTADTLDRLVAAALRTCAREDGDGADAR